MIQATPPVATDARRQLILPLVLPQVKISPCPTPSYTAF